MWFFIYYLCLWVLFWEFKLLSSCRVKVLENENEEWVRNNQCYITWSYDTHQKNIYNRTEENKQQKDPATATNLVGFVHFFCFYFYLF